MVNYDRPLGIPLLAYLLWLLALIIIVSAVYVFFYEDEFWYHGLLQSLGSELGNLLVVMTFSMLIISSGIGLLKSSSRGRGLLVALCAIGAIHGVIMAFSDLFRGILVLILCVVVTIYMLTPRVSAEFKTIDSRKAVDAIEKLKSYRKSRFY